MSNDVPKVTGIGGVFFKAKDPVALAAWYDEYLGFSFGKGSYVSFEWINPHSETEPGQTAFSFFKADSNYFAPSTKDYMLNLRVSNLDGLLEKLRKSGVWVDDKVDKADYGKFGRCLDPEGNKLELWEP